MDDTFEECAEIFSSGSFLFDIVSCIRNACYSGVVEIQFAKCGFWNVSIRSGFTVINCLVNYNETKKRSEFKK